MANAVKYLANVGRSVKYATVDVLKEMNPVVTDVIETNQDIAKVTYSSIKNFKSLSAKAMKSLSSSQVGELAKDLKKNLVEDIKNGTFYNKARKEKVTDEAAAAAMDFDLSEFTVDESEDFSEDDFSVTDAIESSAERSVNAVSNVLARTAEYQVEATRQSTTRMLAQTAAMSATLHSDLGVLNANVTGLVKFNNDAMAVHIENSRAFYERQQQQMEEQTSILREMLEFQKSIMTPKSKSTTSKVRLSDVFTSEGSLNLAEYFKLVQQNVKDLDVLGMGGMVSELNAAGGFKAMAANPIGEIMKSAIKSSLPQILKESFAEFNETLAGSMSTIMIKASKARNSTNPIVSLLGNIFGADLPSGDKKMSTSKYEKGATMWTGKDHKALTEVIPTLLNKIYSAVSGEKETRYDYESGKFVSMKDIKKSYDRRKNQYVTQANDTIMPYLEKMIDSVNFGNEERMKEFVKSLETVLKQEFKNHGYFNPNDRSLSAKTYGLKGRNAEQDFALIRRMFAQIPKNKQLRNNQDLIEASRAYADWLSGEESRGDSIYANLFNNSKNKNKGKQTPIFSIGDKLDTTNALLQNIRDLIAAGGGTKTNATIRRRLRAGTVKGPRQSTTSKTDDSNSIAISDLGIRLTNNEKAAFNISDDPNSFTFNNDIESDTEYIKKIRSAETATKKIAAILSGTATLAKQPVKFLSNVLRSVDNRMYTLLFGSEKDGKNSITGKISEGLDNWFDDIRDIARRKFDDLKDWIKEKTLGEKASSLFENIFGFDLKDWFGDFKEAAFGDRDASFVDGMRNLFKQGFSDMFQGVKNIFKDATSLYGSGLTEGGREQQRTNTENSKLARRLRGGIRVAARKGTGTNDDGTGETENIGTASSGRRVTKTGVVAVSEGEIIVPPDYDKKKISDRNRKEQTQISKFKSAYKKINRIASFAKGGTVGEDEEPINFKKLAKDLVDQVTTKKITEDEYNEVVNRYHKNSEFLGYLKTYVDQWEKKNTRKLTKDDYVDGKGGFMDRAKDSIKDLYDSLMESNVVKDVSGKLSNALSKDNKSEGKDVMKDVVGNFGKYLPRMASGGVAGAGLSILLGLAGGPVLGAAVGAGLGLLSNSKKLRTWLFGEKMVDEEGNETIKGGILSDDIKKNVHKYFPGMAKGAIVGGITSILPFVPGGPMAGILVGSAVGFARSNDTMKKNLFGDDKALGKMKNVLKDKLPKMGLGAAAGFLAGPFGLTTNLIVGAGLGFVSDTDKFKDIIFGTKGSNGERTGGLVGYISEAAKVPIDTMKKIYEDTANWFKNKFLPPLQKAVDPITRQFKNIGNWFKDAITSGIKDHITRPIGRKIMDNFVLPFEKLAGGVLRGLLAPGRMMLTGVSKGIGLVGGGLRSHQLRTIGGASGDARSRVLEMEQRDANRRFKKYTNTDAYKLDSFIADLDNEQVTETQAMFDYLAENRGSLSIGKRKKSQDKYVRSILTSNDKLIFNDLKQLADKRIMSTKVFDELERYIVNGDTEATLKLYDGIHVNPDKGFSEKDKAALRKRIEKAIQVSQKAREDAKSIHSRVAEMEKKYGIDLEKNASRISRTLKQERQERGLDQEPVQEEKTPEEQITTALVTTEDAMKMRHEDLMSTLNNISDMLEVIAFPDSKDAVMARRAKGTASKVEDAAEQEEKLLPMVITPNDAQAMANEGLTTDANAIINGKATQSHMKTSLKRLVNKVFRRSKQSKTVMTENGPIKMRIDNQGNEIPDERDSETKETLRNAEEDDNTQKGILSKLSVLGDGLKGLFSSKGKEEGEEKEGIFSKIFNIAGSIASGIGNLLGAKGAAILGGLGILGLSQKEISVPKKDEEGNVMKDTNGNVIMENTTIGALLLDALGRFWDGFLKPGLGKLGDWLIGTGVPTFTKWLFKNLPTLVGGAIKGAAEGIYEAFTGTGDNDPDSDEIESKFSVNTGSGGLSSGLPTYQGSQIQAEALSTIQSGTSSTGNSGGGSTSSNIQFSYTDNGTGTGSMSSTGSGIGTSTGNNSNTVNRVQQNTNNSTVPQTSNTGVSGSASSLQPIGMAESRNTAPTSNNEIIKEIKNSLAYKNAGPALKRKILPQLVSVWNNNIYLEQFPGWKVKDILNYDGNAVQIDQEGSDSFYIKGYQIVSFPAAASQILGIDTSLTDEEREENTDNEGYRRDTGPVATTARAALRGAILGNAGGKGLGAYTKLTTVKYNALRNLPIVRHIPSWNEAMTGVYLAENLPAYVGNMASEITGNMRNGTRFAEAAQGAWNSTKEMIGKNFDDIAKSSSNKGGVWNKGYRMIDAYRNSDADTLLGKLSDTWKNSKKDKSRTAWGRTKQLGKGILDTVKKTPGAIANTVSNIGSRISDAGSIGGAISNYANEKVTNAKNAVTTAKDNVVNKINTTKQNIHDTLFEISDEDWEKARGTSSTSGSSSASSSTNTSSSGATNTSSGSSSTVNRATQSADDIAEAASDVTDNISSSATSASTAGGTSTVNRATQSADDIVDTVSDVTDNISSGASASRASNAAANAAGEVIDEATDNKGALQKLIDFVSGGLKKFFGNNKIINQIKKALNKGQVKKEIAEQAIKNGLTKLAEKLLKTFTNKAAKIAAKILVKFSSYIGSGFILAAAEAVLSFATGMKNADAIMGVQEPTMFERLISGIVNALNNNILLGIIPTDTIISVVSGFIEGLGVDLSDFRERQAAAQAEVDKYNAEKGTHYNVYDYFMKDKVETKIKNFLGTIWNSQPMSIVRGTVGAVGDVAGGVLGGVVDVGGGVIKGIGDVAGGVLGGVGNVASGVLNGGKQIFSGDVGGGLKTIGSGLWNGAKSVAGGVWNGLKTAGTGVVNGLKSVGGGLANAGKSFVNGIAGLFGKKVFKDEEDKADEEALAQAEEEVEKLNEGDTPENSENTEAQSNLTAGAAGGAIGGLSATGATGGASQTVDQTMQATDQIQQQIANGIPVYDNDGNIVGVDMDGDGNADSMFVPQGDGGEVALVPVDNTGATQTTENKPQSILGAIGSGIKGLVGKLTGSGQQQEQTQQQVQYDENGNPIQTQTQEKPKSIFDWIKTGASNIVNKVKGTLTSEPATDENGKPKSLLDAVKMAGSNIIDKITGRKKEEGAEGETAEGEDQAALAENGEGNIISDENRDKINSAFNEINQDIPSMIDKTKSNLEKYFGLSDIKNPSGTASTEADDSGPKGLFSSLKGMWTKVKSKVSPFVKKLPETMEKGVKDLGRFLAVSMGFAAPEDKDVDLSDIVNDKSYVDKHVKKIGEDSPFAFLGGVTGTVSQNEEVQKESQKEMEHSASEDTKKSTTRTFTSTVATAAKTVLNSISNFFGFGGKGSGIGNKNADPQNMSLGFDPSSSKDLFVSQTSGEYAKRSFTVAGDRTRQTVADAGCAPAVATMAINSAGFSAQPITMDQAMKNALAYKRPNGGVTADYFVDEFENHGLGTAYVTANNPKMRDIIVNRLRSGEPVVLMGQDEKNKSKTASPFGPQTHYVVATKVSKDGKTIYINDPEANRPNIPYKVSTLMKGVVMGISPVVKNSTNKKLNSVITKIKRFFRQFSASGKYGEDTVEYKIWTYMRAKGFSEVATAAAMGNFYAESGMDPAVIEKGSGAGYGLAQWTGSQRTALNNYASEHGQDVSKIETQIDFLDYDINTKKTWINGRESMYGISDRYTIDTFLTGNDVEKAAKAFMCGYEGPAGWAGTQSKDKRANAAKEYFEEFTGTAVPESTGNTGSDGSGSEESGGTIIDQLITAFTSLAGLFGLDSGDSSGITVGDGEIGSTYVDMGDIRGNVSANSDYAEKQIELVKKMKSVEGKLIYSQGPYSSYCPGESRDPDKGMGDCSSTVQWAYQKVLGVDPGTTTYAQEEDSDLYTVTTNFAEEDKMQLGDVLLKDGHVEMYYGDGRMIGHGGGKGGKTPGPTIKNLGTTPPYYMVRRWVGFKNSSGSTMFDGSKDSEPTSTNDTVVNAPTPVPMAKGSGLFVSQNSPRYANKMMGNSTVADAGCAPAVATMAISSEYDKRTSYNMNKAINNATRYQTNTGAVTVDYFADEFSKYGMSPSYINGSDTKALVDAISSGNVVLLGKDSKNTSKRRSPFGPTNHYVLATGISKDGKHVYINDPEAKRGNVKYPIDILNHTVLGINTKGGVVGQISQKLRSKLKALSGTATYTYLFAGDSRTVGMQMAVGDSHPDTLFIAKVSMGYEWLQNKALPDIKNAMNQNPDMKLVFWFGVNDLMYASRYVALYKELESEYDKNRIWYMSVGPVSGKQLVTNEQIEEFNTKLKAHAGSRYIDVYTKLKNEGFESSDGLHYNSDTYSKIYDFVIQTIGSGGSSSSGGTTTIDTTTEEETGNNPITQIISAFDQLAVAYGLKSASSSSGSTSSSDSSSSGSYSGDTAEEQVWSYMQNKGIPDAGIAGLMGNIKNESGFKFNNVENSLEKILKNKGKSYHTDETYTQAVDNGTISKDEFLHPLGGDTQYGYGLVQWTSAGRKDGLYELVKSRNASIADPGSQLDWLWQELNNSYPSVLNTMKTSSSVKDVSNVVLKKFEAPTRKDDPAVENQRYQDSQAYYDQFHGKTIDADLTTVSNISKTNKPVTNAPTPIPMAKGSGLMDTDTAVETLETPSYARYSTTTTTTTSGSNRTRMVTAKSNQSSSIDKLIEVVVKLLAQVVDNTSSIKDIASLLVKLVELQNSSTSGTPDRDLLKGVFTAQELASKALMDSARSTQEDEIARLLRSVNDIARQ